MPELDIKIGTTYDGSGATKAKRDMKEMRGLSGTLKGGFADLQGAMGTAFKVGGVAAVAGAAAMGAAITGIAASGINEFRQFEAGMNEVFTLLPGISANAMGQMTQQVKEFSTEFGTLPNQVVPALYQAISAGVPQDNVFSFLETAQKAAIGGVSTLETAVDGISSVVNSYGADVLSAAEASDYMFTAVRLGKTNFDELSTSLFNVVPVASALGVGFGEVSAGLAAMTAQGVPTSVATTQLRQLLVELSKEGTAVADTFEELSGHSFREFIAQGNFTQDALRMLESHAKDTGVGINDLFGSVEAGNAALALTGKGTEAYTNALAEMEDSAGATEQAFDRMQTGLQPIFNRLQAMWKVALLDIGAALAPALEPVVSWLERVLPDAIDVAVGFFEKIGLATSTFFDALSDGETVMSAFRLALDSILTPEQATFLADLEADIRAIIGAIDTATQPIQDFIAEWVSLKDVMIALGIVAGVTVVQALAGIATALGAPLLVLGLLVGAVALVRNAWERDWAGIKTLVQSNTDEIKMIWDGLWEGFSTGSWIKLEIGLNNLWSNIKFWFELQKLRIKNQVDGWWTQFTGSEFWSSLSASFTALQTSIGSWFGAQVDVIYARVSGWFSQFSTDAGFGSGLTTAVETLVTDIQSKFATAQETIANLFSGTGEGSITIGEWTVDLNLSSLKTAIADQITGLTWTAEDGFDLDLSVLATSIQDAIQANLNAVSWTEEAGFEVDMSAVRSPVLTAISAGLAGLDWASETFTPDMTGLASSVVTSLQTHWDALMASWEVPFEVGGLVDSISEAFEDLDFKAVGTTAGTSFATMVNTISAELAKVDWTIITAGAFVLLAEAVTAAIKAIQWSFDEGVFAGLKAGLRAGIQGIDWSTIGTQGGEMFNGLVAGIALGIKTLWTGEGPFSADTWSGLGESIVNSLRSTFGEGAGPLTGVSADLFLGFEEAVYASMREIGWGDESGINFDGLSDAVSTAISSLPWDLAGAFDSLVTVVQDAISSALSSLDPRNWGGGGDSGSVTPQGSVTGNALTLDDFWPSPAPAVPVTVEPDVTELMDFLGGLKTTPTEITIEPRFGKEGGGLKSLIPPEDRKVDIEITPVMAGGGKMGGLADLFPKGADFEIAKPAWLASLIDWDANEPAWQAPLLAWIPKEPPWQNALTSWIAITPPWHGPLLSWVARTPPWVPQLTSWVAPTPGWVPALLGFTLPRPTWWGTEAGYIQKPAWWGSSAGTITNVSRVENVGVRSQARAEGMR